MPKLHYELAERFYLETRFLVPLGPRGPPHLPRKFVPPITPGELSREVNNEHVSRIREGGLSTGIAPTRATVRRGHVQLVVVRAYTHRSATSRHWSGWACLPPKVHAVTFNAVGKKTSRSISPSLVYLIILDPPQLHPPKGDNQRVDTFGEHCRRTNRADHTTPSLSMQRPSGYVPSGRPCDRASTKPRFLETFPSS